MLNTIIVLSLPLAFILLIYLINLFSAKEKENIEKGLVGEQSESKFDWRAPGPATGILLGYYASKWMNKE